MKYMQAQFSIKFEPIVRIRRMANIIEDKLQDNYMPPQTMPVPDDFAAEAPRIILNSKGGHSQITFSQYSVDLTVSFDGEYITSFNKTKDYVLQRIAQVKDLLNDLEKDSFYFFGITYNARLDMQGEDYIEYMKNFLNNSFEDNGALYEGSQRVAVVEDNKFFVNEQIGTYREYQSNGNGSMDLLNLVDNKINDEGINLSIDVNNRYSFLTSGESKSFDFFDDDLNWIYNKLESDLARWE